MDARILVSLIIVVIAILCGVWSFIKLPNKVKINSLKYNQTITKIGD